MSNEKDAEDGIRWWSLVWPGLLALALRVSGSFWPSATEVLAPIPLVLLAFYLLVVITIRLVRRRWNRASATVAGLFAGWAVGIYAHDIGDYVHLAVGYPSYTTAIGGRPGAVSFNWGGTGFVGSAQTDIVLIYDSTGKTRELPYQIDSEADCKEVRRLTQNFYVSTYYFGYLCKKVAER
jgi:hypothetical protein